MAYALQLHQDLDHDPQKRHGQVELSFIDREIRRRTMWSCFLMDRFNSSGTDRPTFIKEETIKVQLPIREKLFQLDMPGPTEDLRGNIPHAILPEAGQLADAKDNMGVAAYMIRSIALWGRIINYLNLGGSEQDPLPKFHSESQYADLVRQTEDFDASLPLALKYNAENLQIHQTDGLDNQYLFLHISAQQNILFMNRFAVPGQPGESPPADLPKDFVTKAGAKAFKAANKISEILNASSSHFVTAPFAGYCAFLSSTIHIFGIFSKNPALEQISKKNLAINVTYITKMKKYWGMFHWMAENLKEQYRVCTEAAKKGPGADGSGTTPSEIFQYGDWFDRYPHGVKHTDFDECGKLLKKEQGDDSVLEQKPEYATVEEYFSTLPPAQARKPDTVKNARGRGGKRAKSDQHDPPQINTSITPPVPSQQTQQHIPQQPHHYQQTHLQPPQPVYNNVSPTSHVDLYHQHSPYITTPTTSHSPNPNFGLMPQLDRQFVFNSYANMDPTSLSSHSVMDNIQAWDGGMGMSGPMGGVASGVSSSDATSAWFMPFNMVPPDINPGTGDVGEGFGTFGSFGGDVYEGR